MILLPESLVYPILKLLHKGAQDRDVLTDLIWPYMKGSHLQKMLKGLYKVIICILKIIPKLNTTHLRREYGIWGYVPLKT
jgi:hypothetical protein